MGILRVVTSVTYCPPKLGTVFLYQSRFSGIATDLKKNWIEKPAGNLKPKNLPYCVLNERKTIRMLKENDKFYLGHEDKYLSLIHI